VDSTNHFDELQEEIIAQVQMSPEDEAKWKKQDVLIHQVFAQSDSGIELLKLWKESLVMLPTAMGGMDSVTIGINEGRKTFIRDILLTIERVEKDG
jgi:hypothetical protein